MSQLDKQGTIVQYYVTFEFYRYTLSIVCNHDSGDNNRNCFYEISAYIVIYFSEYILIYPHINFNFIL